METPGISYSTIPRFSDLQVQHVGGLELRSADSCLMFYPIGSSRMVYMRTKLGYIPGKCDTIYGIHGSYGYECTLHDDEFS